MPSPDLVARPRVPVLGDQPAQRLARSELMAPSDGGMVDVIMRLIDAIP